MTEPEQAAVETPRRRRKRWLLLVPVILFLAWMIFSPSRLMQRAERVQLGMTYAEVLQIMGRPSIVFRGDTITFGPSPMGSQAPDAVGYDEMSRTVRDTLQLLAARIGLPVQIPAMLSESDWPVYLKFGADGRVISIRRGDEGLLDPDSSLLNDQGTYPIIRQP
jgi:hypothetical protein